LSWPVRMGASPLLPWPLQKDLGCRERMRRGMVSWLG